MPVPYGEMLVGSRRISQTSAPVMRAETGKWWLSGGDENKNPAELAELRERTMKINVMELFSGIKK